MNQKMNRPLKRRELLELGFTQMSLAALVGNMPLKIFANSAAADQSQKVFVFIFLRGAMDALSALVPVKEENYSLWRPQIKIQTSEIKAPLIDDHFAFHPQFKNMSRFWQNKQLSMVTNCGSADPTRSHFDAQDIIEFASANKTGSRDGVFNRVMQQHMTAKDDWTLLAIQQTLPRSLEGSFSALSINELKDLKSPVSKLGGTANLEALYAGAADQVLRGTNSSMFKKMDESQKKIADVMQGNFPKSKMASHLRNASLAIRAKLGTQLIVTEMGGWDTHVGQGTLEGKFNKNITELDEALGAFVTDLGDEFKNVTVVLMSEFGRTVKENGNKGTDHGHGTVAWILGGGVKGGRRLGQWAPLKTENLFEGRDVPVSTDYREVLASVFKHHYHVRDWSKIFPGYQLKNTLQLFS